MKIPLAEHFHSIQGEGQWVGTPMHFIRLPGCTVGKLGRHTDANNDAPILPGGRPAWLCHRFDGQPFWCDTDFHKYEEVELDALISETWESHICLTGGEPLMHPQIVQAFVDECALVGIRLHIETSGTIAYDYPVWVWVTCSPKQGWNIDAVETADELKLLVDETFPDHLPLSFLNHPNVYVSPINPIERVDMSLGYNMDKVNEILRKYPSWKLSIQLHKYLGMR